MALGVFFHGFKGYIAEVRGTIAQLQECHLLFIGQRRALWAGRIFELCLGGWTSIVS